MIYSSSDDASSKDLQPYDVCIIGSGPAGLTLCAELLYTGLRLCVIESGTFGESAFADNLRTLKSEGLPITENSRERTVGGTSKTWRGISAPLDPIDFKKRLAGNAIGWPFSFSDLAPYYERAARYGFPTLSAFGSGPLPIDEGDIDGKQFLIQDRPLRFGRKFAYLFRRKNVDLFTETTATALAIGTVAGKKTIRAVRCRHTSGKEFEIQARAFIVAAGAIENARLLLNSLDEKLVSAGNEHDQVGRYFMDHPKGYVGEIMFNKALPRSDALFRNARGAFSGYTGLRLKEEIQNARSVLNATLQIEEILPWQRARAARRVGALLTTLRASMYDLKHGAWRSAIEHSGSWLKDLLALIPAIPYLTWVTIQYGSFRIHPYVRRARVRVFLEMEARPENRVVLGDRSDALGMPIAVVKHSLGTRDIESAEVLLGAFQNMSVRNNFATFKRASGKLDELIVIDAAHHLGTTRMGSDPRTSVVNSDLRVHSLGNLYMAGGSVFPTSGCANPTMTIVALSIRLADHVRTILSTSPIAMERANPTGVPILVIGAGRRIADDVIPVVEALGCDVKGIFAHSTGVVFGTKRSYGVQTLDSITPHILKEVRFVYVAVPPSQIASVLGTLSRYDCAHLELILDTPAAYGSLYRHLYARFRRVQVAEDIAFLPWIDLVHRAADAAGPLGDIRTIVCKGCAYRYHGIALIKALSGKNIIGGFSVPRSGMLLLPSIRAYISGVIDYKTGALTIAGSHGRIGSHADAPLPIRCIREQGHCAGFTLGAIETKLSSIESELAGPFTSSDTVISRMADLKRVGLYRLLGKVLQGECAYPLEEGINDARIDARLRRIGFFFSLLG